MAPFKRRESPVYLPCAVTGGNGLAAGLPAGCVTSPNGQLRMLPGNGCGTSSRCGLGGV